MLRARSFSGGLVSPFDIKQVAADPAYVVRGRHRNDVAQEAVRIRKEMDVRVERKAVLALERHDDQEPLGTYAPQLIDGPADVEHVLEHMSADDGVELR